MRQFKKTWPLSCSEKFFLSFVFWFYGIFLYLKKICINSFKTSQIGICQILDTRDNQQKMDQKLPSDFTLYWSNSIISFFLSLSILYLSRFWYKVTSFYYCMLCFTTLLYQSSINALTNFWEDNFEDQKLFLKNFLKIHANILRNFTP